MIIMSIIEDTNIKEEDITEAEDEDACTTPPLLPIRPTPTSLFQPFLPRPQPGHKSLAFSIDNILRPTFGGCQMTQPPRPLFSSPFFHSSFMALMAAAAAATTPHPMGPSPMASPLSTSSSTASTPVPTAAAVVKREVEKLKPVDLSSASSKKLSKSPNNDNNNITVSDEELPNGIKRDEDCPPGMVRGPNGQLWPAWVFCTRYSDRPSSGEYTNNPFDAMLFSLLLHLRSGMFIPSTENSQQYQLN